MASQLIASNPNADFGAWVAGQLSEHAEQLFGFRHPLEKARLGPMTGPTTCRPSRLPRVCTCRSCRARVASAADQIALWPNDDHPTHLFVCDEETSIPAVQRVDLSRPANANATTIVTGLTSCDPVRRTPWGTIIVAEEAGATGGFYELIDPVHITTRDQRERPRRRDDQRSAASREAQGGRQPVVRELRDQADGTMIYGDELAPSGGNAGGGDLQVRAGDSVPGRRPDHGSRAVAARIGHDLRAARRRVGLVELGPGRRNRQWRVDGGEPGRRRTSSTPTNNIILRNAQALQKFTGYYRPEDMDIDPIAAEKGVFRACWANTGRMSHTDSSLVENSGVESEIMCLVENPPSTAVPDAADRDHPDGRAFHHRQRGTRHVSTTSPSSRTRAISSSSKTAPSTS